MPIAAEERSDLIEREGEKRDKHLAEGDGEENADGGSVNHRSGRAEDRAAKTTGKRGLQHGEEKSDAAYGHAAGEGEAKAGDRRNTARSKNDEDIGDRMAASSRTHRREPAPLPRGGRPLRRTRSPECQPGIQDDADGITSNDTARAERPRSPPEDERVAEANLRGFPIWLVGKNSSDAKPGSVGEKDAIERRDEVGGVERMAVGRSAGGSSTIPRRTASPIQI